MGFKSNFSDVDSFTGFEAIPAGLYHVKVTDGTETEVKNEGGKLEQGTPGVNWEFTVQDGEFAGRKVFTNTWIHPRTMGFVKGLLESSGRFTNEQLSGDLDWEIDQVIGADVMVKVAVRQYNGDDVNDVKSIKPFKGETSESSSSSSLLPG
jgi:hypothetical protein